MLGPSSPPAARRRPAARVLLAPIVLALLLHGWLLGGAHAIVGSVPTAQASAAPLRVRTLDAAASTTAVVASPQPPRATEPPRRPVARPAPRTLRGPLGPVQADARLATPAGPATEPAAGTPRDTPVAGEAALADVVVALSTPVAAAGPPTAEGETAVPVYRTLMPPSTRLHYDMRRGFFSGSGELSWSVDAGRYELHLEGRVAGVTVITQASRGTIDEHGIAPLRYTDQRIRRAADAANFQRDKNKITYSGPQVDYPLIAGAQDRLSWMIQIAAVLNAEPQLAVPGGRIAFFVTGARGDADVWVFRYVATESVRADGGELRAVKFTREPRSPYDRMVEVWLAPERHHLPVRARLTAEAGGDIFELLLRDMRAP